jgi:hypothetical protein
VNSVDKSGDLLSSAVPNTGFTRETRVFPTGAIIESLDAYFNWPERNFDWSFSSSSAAHQRLFAQNQTFPINSNQLYSGISAMISQ